jgi:hypothetical protein
MARRLVTFATAASIVSASATAAATVPASLSWSAPLSCPSRDTILELLQEAGDDPAHPSPIDVQVVVEQEGEDAFHARLVLVVDHAWEERSLDGYTCDAIADAVIVVVRVASRLRPVAPPVTTPAPASSQDAAPRPPSATSVTPARPHAGFGNGSQLVVSMDLEATFGVTKSLLGPWIAVAPSADVFVAHRVSLGGTLVYEQTPNVFGPAATTVSGTGAIASPWVPGVWSGAGVSARVGYDARLSDPVSIWPAFSFSYEHIWSGPLSADGVLAGVFVPLLFHAGHAVLGVGPDFGLGVRVGGSAPYGFEYGLRLTVGAWADLSSEGPS